MAERTVKVSLLLQASGYMAGMDAAAQKTARTGTEIEKLSQKRESFQMLGTAAVGFGAAAAVGVGLAVSKFVEFDQQMSSVQASTHETAENMGLLRDASLEAGAATVYSATEAASAVEELAKAGVSTANILAGALGGSLDLAAAGGLGVARAAEITSTALNQYALDGSKAAHVADVLAAGAGKAMGSVDDLANGLKFVGPVAASMGVSLEETTGVLALFAQQGIIGEQAGTSLRGVIASLTAPSAQARGEIERLGLTLYDSNGKFLGLQNAAEQLSNAYTNMDDASRNASMGIIFGRETMTAATALYGAGAAGVEEWTSKVDDSGYAAETARARLNNLAGDVEALGGAFDTALIKTGSGANGVLREMVQGASALVDMYNDVPAPVQAATLLIGAATAAVGLSAGAALLAVPKWAELRATVSAAGFSMGRIAMQGAGVGIALAGLGAVMGAVIARQSEMRAGASEFADTLDATTGAVTDNTRKMIAKRLADQGVFEQASKVGLSQRELTDALYQGGDAAQGVIDKFKAASSATGGFDIGLQDAMRAVDDMNTQVGDSKIRQENYRAALEGTTGALSESEDAASRNERALSALAGQASSTKVDVEGLANAINGFGSAQLDANSAARKVEQAFDDLQESINENGSSLDRTIQAGRDNEAALDDMARASVEYAAAIATQTGDQEAASQAIQDGRDRLISMLEQFGITGEAAQIYADQLGLIPGNVPTAVTLNTSEAQQQLSTFLTDIQNRHASLTVRVNTMLQSGASDRELADAVGVSLGNYTGNLYDHAKPKAFEAGGFASGVYAGRAGGIHKFAEGNLPWEAYISPDPAYREKNLQILDEVGSRLGAWQRPTVSAMPQMSGGGATSGASLSTGDFNLYDTGLSRSEVKELISDEFRKFSRGGL